MFNKEDRVSVASEGGVGVICWRKAAILGILTTPNQKELGWKSRKGVQTQGFGFYSAVTENQVETSLIKKRVETISVCAQIGDEDSSIFLPFIWNHIKTCLLVQRGTRSHLCDTFPPEIPENLRKWWKWFIKGTSSCTCDGQLWLDRALSQPTNSLCVISVDATSSFSQMETPQRMRLNGNTFGRLRVLQVNFILNADRRAWTTWRWLTHQEDRHFGHSLILWLRMAIKNIMGQLLWYTPIIHRRKILSVKTSTYK